jgi:integrase
MQFTKATIAALEVPADKNDTIEWDDTMPGFGVRCRAGGSRTWIIQYRIGGQQRRESLGDVRKVDLAEARRIARQRFASVQLGKDPREPRAPKLSLLQAIELYQARTVVRPSTFKKRDYVLRTLWRPLHGWPLASISRADIAGVLESIAAERGRATAGRARTTLAALCAWAVQRDLIDRNVVATSINPAAGMSARDRVLEDSELAVILRTCGDDNTFGRIIWLLVLTGSRASEIAGLRWSEIDLESRLLVIPPERVKTGKTLRLILPAQALAILKAVSRKDGCEFVFPSERGTAFTAWSYCKAALDVRITEALRRPLVSWRTHDLRRSVRSGLSRIGVRPDVAEAVLNHAKRGILATYDHYDYRREVQAALAAWADHVELIINGKPGKASNKVVPLRKA